jgi:hypothetical protein
MGITSLLYDSPFYRFKTGLSTALLHELNQFRSGDYLTWFRQKDCTTDAERSASVLLIQHTDSGANLHICQPLIPAPWPGWGYNPAAVRKCHVGDQLLPFAPPFAVDGGNEFSGLIIEFVILPIEFGFPKLMPG